jgi:HD-like signal output (HDOD) protein
MDQYLKHLKSLPVNPSIAAKVLVMLDRQDFSFKQLEEIISADPGLTAKILKIANSALYARQNQITKLQTAITLLGINMIKNLVVLFTGAGLFSGYGKSRFCSLFWRHSLATAFISKELSLRYGLQAMAEEAFIAGLLHNVGQVALFMHDPAAYEDILTEVLTAGGRFSAMEMPRYGATHREVGGALLTQWLFPEVYSDCAREHGETNIASRWKQLIQYVSIAAFIAGNWVYFEDAPKPYHLLDPLLVFLGLDAPGIDAYQAEYLELLKQDKFYQECQGLIKS